MKDDAVLEMGSTEDLRTSGSTLKKEVEQLVELADKLVEMKTKLDGWNPTQPTQQQIKTSAFDAIDRLKEHMVEMNTCVESFGDVAIQGANLMETADELVAKQFNA